MTTYSWNGVNGDWSNAADWTPSGVPNSATAIADITASGSYAVTIASGESYAAGSVTIGNSNAALYVNGTASLNVTGSFANSGVLGLDAFAQGGGTLEIGGTLTNAGTFDVGSDGFSTPATATLGGLVNESGAAVTIYGGATINVDGAVSNSGSLDVEDGVFELTGAGSLNQASTGTLIVNTGGTLSIASGDTATLAGTTDLNGNVEGAGTIHNYGTFEKTSTSGISVIQVNFVDVGTVVCAGGNLQFYGAHNSLSGTYIGPGMIDYGPGSVSTLANLNITRSACSTNFGVVRVAGLVTIADGSTITNLAGATWNFVGDFGLTLAAGSTGPRFTNVGAMAKTAGTGTSVVAIDVTSTGTVTAKTGTLAFDGPTNSFSGAFKGAGEIAFTGGDTTIAAGATATVAGLAETGAGTNVTLDENLTYAHTFSAGSGATLNLSGGNLTLTGNDSFAGATTIGSHTSERQGNDHRIGPDDRRNDDLRQLRRADAERRRRNLRRRGRGRGQAPERVGRNLGHHRRQRDRARLLALLSISNSGLFEKTGGTGTSTIAPKFANNGQVVVTSGTLDFEHAVTGTGTDTISPGATLEFDSCGGAAKTTRRADCRLHPRPAACSI